MFSSHLTHSLTSTPACPFFETERM